MTTDPRPALPEPQTQEPTPMREDAVRVLRELAELAYDGRHPSISMKRAVALSEAADEIDRLRAGIRQWASECTGCDGTGVGLVNGMSVDCEDCADIRALLADGPVCAEAQSGSNGGASP